MMNTGSLLLLLGGVVPITAQLVHVKNEAYGECKYTGSWKSGKFYGGDPDGHGMCIWTNGDTYTGDWKSGKREGRGTHVQADGSMYKGQWQNDKREGFGTYMWADGDKYEGEWENDKKEGYGRFISADGSTYNGQFKGGLKEGNGTHIFSNGDNYEGQFKGGLLEGNGTYIHANGDKYEGQWQNDKRHGRGTFVWAGGSTYTGQYRNGLKDGHGTFIWADGKTYTGQYQNGSKQGHGTIILPNGDKYEGQWQNDKYQGQGTLIMANGNKYEGQWQSGKRHGRGTFVWAGGSTYIGQYKNGLKDGYGTFILDNGDKYEGQWQNGKYQGQGTFVWVDGKTYTGQYKNDLKWGYGTMVLPNGEMYAGEWKRGRRDGHAMYRDVNGWVYEEVWEEDKRMRREGPTIVFLGNAGVGKSTIVNTILGEAKCQAGRSKDGTGVTKKHAKHVISSGKLKGISLLDTAGWENQATKEEAASQIKSLLKRNHQVKVIFVMTLEAGRVGRNSEYINEFISHVQKEVSGRIRFGVIVNKAEMLEDDNKKCIEQLLSYELDAETVIIIKKEDEAHLEDNTLLSGDNRGKIEHFIEQLPAARISGQHDDMQAILLMAHACSLNYFFADVLSSNLSDSKKEALSNDSVSFEAVVSELGSIPEKDRYFEEKYKILKDYYEENKRKGEENGQGSGVLSFVSHTNTSGGLLYTVTVSPAFKRIIVCFRGSVSGQDWLQNVQFLKKEVQHGGSSINVHMGIYDYLDEKYADIKQHVTTLQKEYEHCKLYVTGHSLGGAVATLFAFRFASDGDFSGKGPITLVSLASPHVGDKYFADAFGDLEKKKMVRHVRVTINSDLVPKALPFAQFVGKAAFFPSLVAYWRPESFYEKVSSLVMGLWSGVIKSKNDYHHVGEHMSLACSESGILEAHSIDTYIKSLEADMDEMEGLCEDVDRMDGSCSA